MPSDEEKKPRIISDEGWKQEARREKEKLREQEKPPAAAAASPGAAQEKTDREPAAPPGDAPEELGPPSFLGLIQSLRLQILFHLGFLCEPGAKDTEVDLEFAQYHIDLLDILQEKTRGNLSAQEDTFLGRILHEVRMAYVQVAAGPPPAGPAESQPPAS
ncbi:MAG: DUF1844 domain-containing protein [Sedimentisphaerales bacterium]|nr:DUF1844 domain-containing protein [Sedimentisphaerales bacterium]